MPTKLGDKIWKCDHCDKVLKTEAGIIAHEQKVHYSKDIRKNIEKEYENIRNTSTSIHEVITRLQTLWSEHGVDVVFHRYPATFQMSVSNSHSAPEGYTQNWGRNPDKPTGYPGWSGSWKGEITRNDTGTNIGGSDLLGRSWGGEDTIPPFPYLHTGSGGGGSNFHYDGKIYLYDFPRMHQEWKETDTNEYDLLEQQHSIAVKEYHNRYEQAKKEYVTSADSTKLCQKLRKELQQLGDELTNLEVRSRNYHIGEFNKAYEVPVPVPESVCVDDEKVMKAVTESSYATAEPLPSLDSTITHITELAKRIQCYREENPEMFL